MNTGYFDAIEIRDGTATHLEVKSLKVGELLLDNKDIKADVNMSGRRVKELYEAQPNTNIFTDKEKQYIRDLMGTNSCVNGGTVMCGIGNRITGKSKVIGSDNMMLANNSIAIGNNNTVLHENCMLIGNGCMTTKNDQTVIGGPNLSFELPFVDDVLEKDLNERGMSICLDPKDGSLLFKVKYMDEIRIFRAPTYGQTIKLNTTLVNHKVNVDISSRNI